VYWEMLMFMLSIISLRKYQIPILSILCCVLQCTERAELTTGHIWQVVTSVSLFQKHHLYCFEREESRTYLTAAKATSCFFSKYSFHLFDRFYFSFNHPRIIFGKCNLPSSAVHRCNECCLIQSWNYWNRSNGKMLLGVLTSKKSKQCDPSHPHIWNNKHGR